MTSPAPVTSADPDAGSGRARGRARAGAEDGAWDREYGRDVWRLRELGITDRGIAHISFTGIPQPWLKNLAKRWTRWRLSTGQVAETAALSVWPVRRFAAFLASPAVSVNRLAQVDRPLLERYLAYLHAELAGRTVHRHMIGQLNLFFTAIRQHGWDSTLPTNAMFFPEDLPKEQRLAQTPHRRSEPAQPAQPRPYPPRRRLGAGHLTKRLQPPATTARADRQPQRPAITTVSGPRAPGQASTPDTGQTAAPSPAIDNPRTSPIQQPPSAASGASARR